MYAPDKKPKKNKNLIFNKPNFTKFNEFKRNFAQKHEIIQNPTYIPETLEEPLPGVWVQLSFFSLSSFTASSTPTLELHEINLF